MFMKNVFLIISVLFCFSQVHAWDAPETLEEACYEGCTPKMEAIYAEFNRLQTAPKFIPGMYSGECYHQSGSLEPETTHYIGLLLNRDNKGAYMSPVLQFFGEENSMKDWSLDTALKEMSPDWIEAGRMTFHKTSATADVEDDNGYPALVYWARQNHETKNISFLAWLRGLSYAFCELTPNHQGLPQNLRK